MSKADLHVHSRYSDHPSEWFLQRIGTSESYTDPEYIYETAKKRGMTFVTISDHNSIRGALELQKNHPDDTFISVESTVYFPEDGCKIHVLLFGITEEQFDIIQKVRSDIYRFRNYIKVENIAYSVAHATYSVNGAVTTEHLEKLVLLFDVFETINGGRNRRNNAEWELFLSSLDKDDMERLQEKHSIEPISHTPWIKGFTAGSDDHAGIFIAKTWTQSSANTVDEFIESIKMKRTDTGGRHHDFHSMAFAIYRIAFDFLRHTQGTTIPALLTFILDAIFKSDAKDIRKNHIYKRLLKSKSPLRKILTELVSEIRCIDIHEMDSRLDMLYSKIADLTDRIVIDFVVSSGEYISQGNLDKILRNISSLLPAVFLTLPFITTFTHMFNNRNLVRSLCEQLGKPSGNKEKRILWFTDTLSEMNGVAVTLREIAWISHTMKKNIRVAALFETHEEKGDIPPNVLEIPAILDYSFPFYENLRLKIPSLLRAIKIINDYDPDEIYVSTPMSGGLLGMTAAKLLAIPCIGIYHTDGTMQAKEIINDITMTNYIEGYMKWFYSSCTRTLVNTREYIEILKTRGYRSDNMELFRRGIDTDMFTPRSNAKQLLRKLYAIPEGVYTLFAGRVSADKGIELAIEAFLEAEADNSHFLLIAGHGPDEEALIRKYKDEKRIIFLGRISHDTMPRIYSGCDVLLFPSVTDTFGRVVAEAMSCGLPVLASDMGGPREIITDSSTGHLIKSREPREWAAALECIFEMIAKNPRVYKHMREAARTHILQYYNMQSFVDQLSSLGNAKQKTAKKEYSYQ